tara:strand:- start:732 stop:1151 length:420 start_codon:yes stop_codon:yes gene_type:complete
MNVQEAAKQFVDRHKPSTIDVDYIESGYGSVEGYLESEAHMGDMGEYQLEIRGFDTKSGNPEIISWYADEAFQISWYDLPSEERKTREDHTCDYCFDIDFDWSIDHAKELIEDGKHDVSVFSLKNGSHEEDLRSYLEQA